MQLRLKELREAHQLTLKQVGTHLKKSYATISRWEHGHSPVASTDLLKLATLYGVHIRDLWEEENDDDNED